MYKGLEEDNTTFGVGATFITSAAVPDEVVNVVTKAVFDNFDDFKKLHPAFAELEEEEMISDGLSAPHPRRCGRLLRRARLDVSTPALAGAPRSPRASSSSSRPHSDAVAGRGAARDDIRP